MDETLAIMDCHTYTRSGEQRVMLDMNQDVAQVILRLIAPELLPALQATPPVSKSGYDTKQTERLMAICHEDKGQGPL